MKEEAKSTRGHCWDKRWSEKIQGGNVKKRGGKYNSEKNNRGEWRGGIKTWV